MQITDFSNFVENSQLKSYLLTYEKFYKAKYSGRSLSWFLEMGSIKVGTVCNENEYTLLLNLYQMALLELFNQKDSISEEEVIDYDDEGNEIKTFDTKKIRVLVSSSRFEEKTKTYDHDFKKDNLIDFAYSKVKNIYNKAFGSENVKDLI